LERDFLTASHLCFCNKVCSSTFSSFSPKFEKTTIQCFARSAIGRFASNSSSVKKLRFPSLWDQTLRCSLKLLTSCPLKCIESIVLLWTEHWKQSLHKEEHKQLIKDVWSKLPKIGPEPGLIFRTWIKTETEIGPSWTQKHSNLFTLLRET
jgi:hypothetical protein